VCALCSDKNGTCAEACLLMCWTRVVFILIYALLWRVRSHYILCAPSVRSLIECVHTYYLVCASCFFLVLEVVCTCGDISAWSLCFIPFNVWWLVMSTCVHGVFQVVWVCLCVAVNNQQAVVIYSF